MFVFELKLVDSNHDFAVRMNEFELATLLRIMKSRNKEMYNKLNGYYEDVSRNVEEI